MPFGYMCLHAISLKYDDTGVSDAIAKYANFVDAKTFNSSNIPQWISKIESTWTEWKNAAVDREHMAAVELLREILNSGDEYGNLGLSIFLPHRAMRLTPSLI